MRPIIDVVEKIMMMPIRTKTAVMIRRGQSMLSEVLDMGFEG